MNSLPAPPALAPALRSTVMEERLSRLRELVAQRQGTALLLDKRRDISWLTVGAQHHVVLSSESAATPILVTREACVALAPVNEAPRIADEELAGLPADIVTVPWHDPDAATKEAERRAGGRLLRVEDLGDEMTRLRSRLAPLEHDRLRWLGAVCVEQLRTILTDVTAGMTEDEVSATVTSDLLRSGMRVPVLLVAADERIDSYRHPLPQGRPIRGRVMLVVVAERWGLHVAATRFRELEPPPDELQARIAACDRVLSAMRTTSRPGATLGSVLAEAEAAYAREGFPQEWQLHHQGGTIGYAGRERIATPGDPTVLEEGMAVAWNPSIRGAKAEATDLVWPEELEPLTG